MALGTGNSNLELGFIVGIQETWKAIEKEEFANKKQLSDHLDEVHLDLDNCAKPRSWAKFGSNMAAVGDTGISAMADQV